VTAPSYSGSYSGFRDAEAGVVLFPWVLAPAFIGDLAFALWLAVKGVDMPVHT
jgi:hypothetical protein